MNKSNLLLIDLDKTLLDIDSFALLYWKMLNARLLLGGALRKLGLFPRFQMARACTREAIHYFETYSVDAFVAELSTHIRKGVVELLNNYRRKNDTPLLLSASPDIYVTKFAKTYGYNGVGSHFKTDNKFVHMYGQNKLTFLNEKYPVAKFHRWFAISDSSSDFAILAKFQNAYCINKGKISRFE